MSDTKLSRPSREAVFMQVAEAFAERSTCNRLHTAAVAVDDTYNIIAVGYNGSLPNQLHCNEPNIGCDIVDGHCIRTLHAEQNLITNCARHGKSLEGAAIYVLHRPCYTCMKLLLACGVYKVFWKHDYNSDGQTENVRKIAALSKVLAGQLLLVNNLY